MSSASGSNITCAVWREVATRERAGARAGVRDESALCSMARRAKIGGGRCVADISSDNASVRCLVEHFERTGRLSVLLIGNARGTVTAYAFGMFSVGRWGACDETVAAVEALAPRDNFETVDAVIRERAGGLKFMRLDVLHRVEREEVYLLSALRRPSRRQNWLEQQRIALDDVRKRYSTGYRDRFDKIFRDFEQALRMTVMHETSTDVRFEFESDSSS